MAYSIPLSKLSQDQKEFIRKMLFLQPEVPFMKSKFSRFSNDSTPPILFFHIEDDIVHLPFLFAGSLLKICPNLDLPFPKTSLEFKGSLRDYQIPVVKTAAEQLQRFGTSTLGLYPGFGKTIIGMKLAAIPQLLVCILVHREVLTMQWKKTAMDVTRITQLDDKGNLVYTDPRVWIVGEKNPPVLCDVIICMDTRTHLIPKALKDAIGFLIIDEAHAFCTPSHVQCLLTFHPQYILAETATLERDDNMHTMIQAIVGTHAINKETDKPFTVMKVNTNVKPERKMNKQGTLDYTALVRDTLFNERRNKIIIDLVLANKDKTIIILTSLVDHVMLLYNKLKELQVECAYMCGNTKNYKDSNVLVGTTSKIGTGFDSATVSTDYRGRPFELLILACSIKKYSMLVQNVGRCFRSKDPYVMHLVDNDDIYKNHWNKAKRWYTSRNGVVVETTVNE